VYILLPNIYFSFPIVKLKTYLSSYSLNSSAFLCRCLSSLHPSPPVPVPPLTMPVSSNSSPNFAPYVPNFKFPTCCSHLLPMCSSCPICLILHQYCTTRHNIISPTFFLPGFHYVAALAPCLKMLETLTKSPLNPINYFQPVSLPLIST